MHVSIDVAWVGLRLWQKDGSVPRVTAADDMSMMHVSIDVAWVGLRLWQKDGSGAHFTVLIIYSLELARAVLRRRAELAGWAYVEYPSPKPWSLQRIPASPRQFRHWTRHAARHSCLISSSCLRPWHCSKWCGGHTNGMRNGILLDWGWSWERPSWHFFLFSVVRDCAALFTTLFGLEYIQSSVLPIAIPIVCFSVGPMSHLLDVATLLCTFPELHVSLGQLDLSVVQNRPSKSSNSKTGHKGITTGHWA